LLQHSRKITRILVVIAALVAASVLDASPARADGAFPDAQAVLLPRDRPRQIILATTFGLVYSDDDGATWTYGCEQAGKTDQGAQYSVGPPPGDRLYAVASGRAPVSEDGGCTWRLAAGAVSGMVVTDVFPDPVDARRVFAIALTADSAAPSSSVYRSLDGGASYAATTLVAPADATVTGVETAASDPARIYATMAAVPAVAPGAPVVVHPSLARSEDGGDTWTTVTLEGTLGAVRPSLIAVDPTDVERVFLRLTSTGSGGTPAEEALAMTRDGGASWSTPLVLAGGTILGFARRSDGSLVVAATDADGPAIYRSDDGGVTFTPTRVAFHPRGLAVRNDVLFVATQFEVDGFALASSDDGGRSWRPRLTFADISGVRSCVKPLCQVNCEYLSGITLFPATACLDKPSGSGGGCDVGGSASRRGLAAMSAMGLLVLVAVRRRRGP
jgi:hypothetical protein